MSWKNKNINECIEKILNNMYSSLRAFLFLSPEEELKELEKEKMEIKAKSEQIAKAYLEKRPYTRRKPLSIACASVYLASKLIFGEDVTQKEVIDPVYHHGKQLLPLQTLREVSREMRKVLGIQSIRIPHKGSTRFKYVLKW